MMKQVFLVGLIGVLALPMSGAQAATKLDSKQPIEISSDNLEVLQEKNEAIFTGNVIAKQGTITMRAVKMTVFYEGEATGEETAAAGAEDSGTMGKGIQRIESEGDVVFITPEETAQGDTAIYDVEADTIVLINNVVLTRQKNILKGTKLTYNLTSGRSFLNGGGATATGGTGRVRGLFVPSQAGK